jgi:hypothetical protein
LVQEFFPDLLEIVCYSMPRLSLALLCIASALVVAQGQTANPVNKYAGDGTFTAATVENCDTSGKTVTIPHRPSASHMPCFITVMPWDFRLS